MQCLEVKFKDFCCKLITVYNKMISKHIPVLSFMLPQDNIDELSQSEHKSCYQSVVEELRIQAKNPVLNPLLVTACGSVMKQHCPKEVSN